MSIKPNKMMRRRSGFVMLIMMLVMVIVSTGSLVDVMVINGEKYQSMASEQQLYDTLISAPRGDIYDRNMKTLATSSPAWTVYITPNGFKNLKDGEAETVRNKIADGLSEILKLEREEVYELTKKSTYYVIVKKKIEKSVADQVRKFITDNKDLSLSNYIGLDSTTKRYYPNDSLASTVLGFVGDDNQGLAGLESYYNNDLTGVSGRVVAAKNAKGTDMPFTYQMLEEAQKGNSIVTTLDSYIQYTCEKYLDDAVAEEQVAERGAAIVMNVKNGEILGMAVSGDFNPNEPFTLSKADQLKVDAEKNEEKKTKLKTELLSRQWRNKAVSDTYEPGSVFKIFTAATALEEGLVNSKSKFSCNYTYMVASNTYHCHLRSGHGVQTMAQAISNSCNPAFIKIGQLIGATTFSKYFKAFGLTEKVGIDLPGEAGTEYHREENMGPTELASSSFGQTFNITPLHMISIAAAAVNGGYLVRPHVAQKLIDEEGNVVKTISTAYKRQVISNETSKTLRTFLEYVIENGAKNGIVAGYRVGGKTGTSQKLSKILSTGKNSLYIGSYVGIAPINNPDIAVFVMLDEPMSGRYYGGAISAPVGAKIMKDVLPYLCHEPQYTKAELSKLSVTVPDVKGNDIATARDKMSAHKISYKIVGNGSKIKKQLPSAGTTIYNGGTVILYTDEEKESNVTVPVLTGLSANDVTKRATDSNINIEFSGNASSSEIKSSTQSIPPGTSVAPGTVVTVHFFDEGNSDLAQ
ncbi:MAG: PASTA domain-containing protein [Clostridia bacterium]|nr:PASTA domain-containing protein [Clostridia bacterium]